MARLLKSLGLPALAGLLVIPVTLLAGAPADRTSKKDTTIVITRGLRDGRSPGVAEAELRFLDRTRRTTFPRPDWWPYGVDGTGLRPYGQVRSTELDSSDVLLLLNDKGSIHVKKSKTRENLPSDLKALGLPGRRGYYIVQVTPELASQGSLAMRQAVESRGGRIIDYIPNNAYLVGIDHKSLRSFEDPGVFQFMTGYQASDKIHPTVGTRPRLNPEYATSDTFELVVRVMEGEDAAEVASEVERLGGTVRLTQEMAGVNYVSAALRNDKVVDLAGHPGVRAINETPDLVLMNLTTSQQTEIGRMLDNREFGAVLMPFRDAKIDGGGTYTGPAVNFKAAGVAGTPIPFDSDLANFSVAPQFLGVVDNGLTMDSPAFSHDNANPCLGTGSCVAGPGGLNVGQSHRKVEVYTRARDVDNNGVVDDATALGDFLTCDSISSGGDTHGTIAASGAAGNPSDGFLGLGRRYDDVDSLDLFSSFFNDSNETNLSLDGQAPGARVIFIDAANTPLTSPPACAINFLSDVDAGDVPVARLEDMAFRRDLNPANATLHPRGAKVTLFAFGSPNFDDNLQNGQGNYANGASDIDRFLFRNRRVLHVGAVGNDGADPLTGGDLDPPNDPNGFTAADIQVNDLATGKNLVTVGAVVADSFQASLDPGETVSNYTSKGPATFASQRGAPLLMAPGTDGGGGFEGRDGRFKDDMFVSLAAVVSLDNENDASEGIENVLIQGRTGTSVAASKVAGAALQIRDYLAKGFYPTAQANPADRIPDVSGLLVKALLINSADFASTGNLASCQGAGPLRCPTEEGYGRVELASTLPLASYRAERRPANATNVAPVPNVPPGLLLVDEYFDGGARGVGSDGSTTGLGVVPVGGSVSFDFYRRDGLDQLRTSLAWYDAEGDTLRNDLDLEVISGDYDITDGGKGFCNTLTLGDSTLHPEFCGYCRYAKLDNQASYYDPTANNPYVKIWRGNQMREFAGQFTLRAECNQNISSFDPCFEPNNPGALCTDFVAAPQNAPDTRNTTEQVIHHYFGDASVFGATRGGGEHGFHRARVRFKNTGSSTPVPHAPAIARGVDGILQTAPAGDDSVLTTGAGVTYIGAGADGIVQTTANAADVQLIPNGSFGQPFALAIAGSVYNSRMGSTVAFNRDVYNCSDRTVTLRVADGSRIPANTNQAETAADVGLRSRIEALDPNGVVQDTEAGLTFTIDPGVVTLRVGRSNHYTSNPRRLQLIADRPGASNPIPRNGIVEVRNGWTLRAVYDDQSPTLPGGSVPDDAVTTARVDCAPVLGPVLLFPAGEAGSGDAMRRTLVTGGCDVGRTRDGRGDFYFDAGESIVYQVGFSNQNLVQAINLKATLSCADPVPGGANPCTFLSPLPQSVELGEIPAGREGIAAWTINVATGVKTLATADRAVDLVVSFTSRGTDWGDQLAAQTFTFREALQADTEVLNYHSDFPLGGTLAADRNRDGIITTLPPGSETRNLELLTFKPLNDTGTCSAGRCSNISRTCLINADCNNPNTAISAQMPWHFDSNAGGFLGRLAADSKRQCPAGCTDSWFYSTGGGCGWQTQNNGNPGVSPLLPKGTWHAGHGPVGTFRAPNACPPYLVVSDPTTAPLTEFAHDLLDSPVLQRVNTAPDARGIPFDIRMETIGWNETQSFLDSFAFTQLEVDSNIDDGGPVTLGDSYSYMTPTPSSMAGPKTSAANQQRTFGPLRDSDGSLLTKTGASGDEVGVSEPIVQRNENDPSERLLMPWPVRDVDPNLIGFQGNTIVDPGTGLPIIPGVCTGGFCSSGGDAQLGMPCVTNAQCTGPGTRGGHSTPWGPVRNREIDLAGGQFEDLRGATGNRFQFELSWWLLEGGTSGGRGWTIDDAYFHWSERHPKDQSDASINDCANIPSRAGANPAARQCATITWERLTTHNCTTGIKVTVTDATPDPAPSGTCTAGRCTAGLPSRIGTSCAAAIDCTCAAGEVAIDARSTTEPLGEGFCLAPQGGGIFSGIVQVSAVVDQKGILNVNATQGENFNIVASYADPECDQDGDGELGENLFRDVDGDGVPNFGVDGVANDISEWFFAEGQGSSDNDNCFDRITLLDVYNPPHTAQRDNDGNGTINAADCHPSVHINNDQCDWDNDGFGDLCDNCPLVANNSQLDTDGDGIGNVCEIQDLDGDGDVNTSDNCPTLYNPSQAGGVRGTFCDSTSDVDGDNLAEINDNCPNEGAVEPPGVAPPFSATYNPSQADSDQDGIGDACDPDDFDQDLVPDGTDNCPTFYNPADPTFHLQTDSDLDIVPANRRYGTGDDRKGIDTIPGAAAYCDPDSADDNLSGVPDDLLQVASELNCEHSRSGTTNLASTPVSVGGIDLQSVALTDDGMSDFFCINGDPDPNNGPGTPEPCPQENPGSPNNDAFCNTPPSGTDGICAGVPDGIADPGELASVRLTLGNTSVDKLGTSIPLNNLTMGIRPLTPSVACTPKAQVLMGTMAAGATGVQTPAGALNFVVDPANPGPGRSSIVKLAEAEFVVTAVADGIEGVPEKTFKFVVDMDRNDSARIPASCPSIPASPAGTLCENFDTNRNGTLGIQFSRHPVSTTPGDPLRANGDPNDDILGYTMNGGPIPLGTDGRTCTDDTLGYVGCQAPVADQNDWHLHSFFEYPGASYDVGGLGPGIGAPDGGKAHSGVRSLHMGRHLSATSTIVDTLRLRQVSAFVLDSQGDPNIPGVVLGPATALDFWHIISIPDDENFGSGFVPPGTSFGGGQVQVSLLGTDGKFERWRPITPSFNGYDSTIQETISVCGFDPGDDQIPFNDETMCDFSPLFADKGDIFGTDATCLIDTDSNDFEHKDCGDRSCTPGPGCTEPSSTPSGGVWNRSAFDLTSFSGRVARLRWIGMMEGGWSFGTDRSTVEPEFCCAYQYFDGDDGWWIDDIRLTDLRQQPAIITPDPVTGLSQCLTGQAAGNCGFISISVPGSVAFGSRRLLGLDSLLQPVTLDARTSTAGDDPNTAGVVEGVCDNGILMFQWEQLDVTTSAVVDVVSPFSPQGMVNVAPSRDALYRVSARCSSDLSCTAQQEVVVKTYTGDGSDLGPQEALNAAGVDTEVGLDVIGGGTATLRWPARPQPPGVTGYDVFRYTYAAATAGTDVFSGNTFDGACFADAVAQTALGTLTTINDANIPAVGTSYFYQVGHSSTDTAALAPLGVQPPSATTRPGQLVAAGVTCP